MSVLSFLHFGVDPVAPLAPSGLRPTPSECPEWLQAFAILQRWAFDLRCLPAPDHLFFTCLTGGTGPRPRPDAVDDGLRKEHGSPPATKSEAQKIKTAFFASSATSPPTSLRHGGIRVHSRLPVRLPRLSLGRSMLMIGEGLEPIRTPRRGGTKSRGRERSARVNVRCSMFVCLPFSASLRDLCGSAVRSLPQPIPLPHKKHPPSCEGGCG